MALSDDSLRLHKQKRGKIEIKSKIPVLQKRDLALVYTPGVAAVSSAIYENKELVYDYTIKHNCVAVLTDGSAVLGLGNIGPQAALPVMEGKALLFKEFADIDAFPICLNTQNTKEIISIAKNIAPVFGGINLEDISAPRCFEVEAALQDIGIPVMHDDQHGTAVVVLAALMNATRVVGKNLEDLKVVISGAGAAGTAITKLLLCMGIDKNICTSVREIIVCDSQGIIYRGRSGLNKYKKEISKATNPDSRKGLLMDAMTSADIFIGVSKGGLVTKDMVLSMNKDPVVFAMANPVPEIMPEQARKVARIVGTGRSDFPNQINNVLAFPGIFRGALDSRALKITDKMKIAAAHALSACVRYPTTEKILPDALDKSVVPAVAAAVKKAWREESL